MRVRILALLGRHGFSIVVTAAGLLLIVAAALKYIDLRAKPRRIEDYWVVFTELSVGGWFLLGLLPRQTRLLGMALFLVLFNVAAYKVSIDATTCGCFGSAHTPPWFALILDAGFVACFFFARPATRAPSPEGHDGRAVALRAGAVLSPIAVAALLMAFSAPTADGQTRSKSATNDVPADPANGILAELRRTYERAQEADDGVQFSAEVIIENPEVKEATTISRRGATAHSRTVIREFPRQEARYEFVLQKANIRRDRVRGQSTEHIAIRREGLTLQCTPSQRHARITEGVDFEATPLDPRCFGLPPGSDNLVRYVSTLTLKPGRAPISLLASGEVTTFEAQDPKGRTLTLTVSKKFDYLPTGITYRSAAGAIESVSQLAYSASGCGSGWYLSAGRQYLFGAKQPESTADTSALDRNCVSKVTYLPTAAPRLLTTSEVERTFDYSLPEGTVVADATTHKGYRTQAADAMVPFHAMQRQGRVGDAAPGTAPSPAGGVLKLWWLIPLNLALIGSLLGGRLLRRRWGMEA